METIHNPDRYMADLRQVLSQGKKRIGLLIGAGAAVSIRVNEFGQVAADGDPLIPDVERLTKSVVQALCPTDREVVDRVVAELQGSQNIEAILTRVRRLAEAIGKSSVHGMNDAGFAQLATNICAQISEKVRVHLPEGPNPYLHLVSWIAGTPRDHPVEVFTTNYDLLLEEALEREHAAYFDGFVGSRRPFFDSASVSTDKLPSRWTLLWKLHGSLGWEEGPDGNIVRTGKSNATAMIYPEHLKYSQVGQLPYSALFERLRSFLMAPDTLLISTGFSFADDHIRAAIEDTLAANAHTALFAFHFGCLSDESAAVGMARRRPNVSVYGQDGAVISRVKGRWQPGQPPNDDWKELRRSFWRADDGGQFVLGDFSQLARFLALVRAQQIESNEKSVEGHPEVGGQNDREENAGAES